jgi:hypothetical protein
MAFQISLTSKSSEIIRDYSPEGIDLQGPYEVGLKHFVFWNTVYNVTSENNTIILIQKKEKKNGSILNIFHHVSVTPGFYELDEIINHLHRLPIFIQSSTYVDIIKQTLKIRIKSVWDIDFTTKNSIGQILGFSKKVIPANTEAFSDLPVNVFSINTVKIHCNLIRSNIEDLKRNRSILYEFPLDTNKIGSKVIKESNPICYFDVNTDVIYELVVRITDQSNKLINFNDEEINLTLDFRPK